MQFKEFFNLYLEMQNAMEFLMNPEHKDKDIHQLEDEFLNSGGKEAGEGAYGKVYTHPKWNYVVKTFTSDDCYLNYARYASRQTGSPFPRFIGSPQRIVPQYTRPYEEKKIYMIRIEKLDDVDEEIFRDFYNHYQKIFRVNDGTQWYGVPAESKEFIIDYCQKNGLSIIRNFQDCYLVLQDLFVRAKANPNYKCFLDIGSNNVMQRPTNGQLVIIDPYAETAQGMPLKRKRLKAKRNKDYNDNLNVKFSGGELTPKPKL